MIGETVSHYRVLDELGGGAMGVVYKALDLRLKRTVALKFLPPGVTRDAEAKKRFVQEAEAASGLDDPHVCTIYDIDETADGRMFIAMAFYEGETLKRRIQRGPIAVADAAGFAEQIAMGLAAAHKAGIIHRDVKPANVMITQRGEVKIVDFGIAKLAGQTDLTGTGLRLGTVAYMAPEQFEGEVDARADLWALGVVMFEMLTGSRPFDGDNDVTTMNAVLNRPPKSVKQLRPEVSDGLAAIVERAMEKDPARRFATADEMAHAIAAAVRPANPPALSASDAASLLRALRRPQVAVPLLAVIAVVAYVLGSLAIGQSRARWAREVALPEIARLLQQDQYEAADALAQQADRYIPHDPMLIDLHGQISQSPVFSTDPDGARVFVKPYSSSHAAWRLIGTTPLKGVTLPRGTYRWRIEADGFEPLEFARNVGDMNAPRPVGLQRANAANDRMVLVSASTGPVDITGFATEDLVALEAYSIGRYEVTNREFKQFVDAGGYARREYWKHDIVREGRVVPWDEAGMLFRDSTGRPGPATWELGDFPAGQAELPVTGVSWYEAAAYAEFRGAKLPTIYHWARAALGFTRAAPIRGRIIAASNYSGKGPVAVGSTDALGPYGAYDMAGNVREWCSNLSGSTRWILGGSWNDHDYMYIVPYSLPPLDRSATNGFRIAKYTADARSASLERPIEVFRRDFRTVTPVSDEVFEVFKRQFSYTASPLDAKEEATDTASTNWRRERISIAAGYGERLTVYLFLPKRGASPRQAVVVFPGLGQYLTQTSSETISPTMYGLDYLLKSNRVVVMPVWKGSYERFDGFVTLDGDRYLQTFRQRMREWRQEVGQLLDYLGTRPDIRADQVGWTSTSFGSSVWLTVLAMEPRFKAAVLLLAGFSYREMLPEVDPVNFVSRIKIPVLMLEARYDHLFPVELSQEPLFNLLGTPLDHKRQVLFDAGHGPLPRGQVIHESLAWLDKYLGPSN